MGKHRGISCFSAVEEFFFEGGFLFLVFEVRVRVGDPGLSRNVEEQQQGSSIGVGGVFSASP